MPVHNFAKSSIAELIAHRLRQSHPELLPQGPEQAGSVRQATISTNQKKDLLDLLWRVAGPEAVLSVGQGILHVGYDPIWHAAVRTTSPTRLFVMWHRFEVFAHSKNRLKIDFLQDRRVSFSRYTLSGGMPSAPENLLICGLVIAMLEQIGCKGLWCEMPMADGSFTTVRADGQFFLPPNSHALATGSWVLGWQDFTPRTETALDEDALPQIPFPLSISVEKKLKIETVARIMMRDIVRQWKVSELAEEAAMSTRSLQRLLKDAGLNFSLLVRLLRINEGCRLLRESDFSITAIGFCAGYSDSAHFSREFRAGMGMSPSDYRSNCTL